MKKAGVSSSPVSGANVEPAVAYHAMRRPAPLQNIGNTGPKAAAVSVNGRPSAVQNTGASINVTIAPQSRSISPIADRNVADAHMDHEKAALIAAGGVMGGLIDVRPKMLHTTSPARNTSKGNNGNHIIPDIITVQTKPHDAVTIQAQDSIGNIDGAMASSRSRSKHKYVIKT